MGKFIKGAWVELQPKPMLPFPEFVNEQTFIDANKKLEQFLGLFEDDMFKGHEWMKYDIDGPYWNKLDLNTKTMLKLLKDYSDFETSEYVAKKQNIINFVRFLIFLYTHDLFSHIRLGWMVWALICSAEDLQYEVDLFTPTEWNKFIKPPRAKA